MFGRLFWLGSGAALGLWGRKKAVHTVEKYVPPVVVGKVTDSVKEFLGDVNKAQKEGRTAMRTKEQQLRKDLEDQP